jgi:hypothetical protein
VEKMSVFVSGSESIFFAEKPITNCATWLYNPLDFFYGAFVSFRFTRVVWFFRRLFKSILALCLALDVNGNKKILEQIRFQAKEFILLETLEPPPRTRMTSEFSNMSSSTIQDESNNELKENQQRPDGYSLSSDLGRDQLLDKYHRVNLCWALFCRALEYFPR